jgi:hypothetical protein
MNIVTTMEQFNEHTLFFCEPIKNTIMEDANFIRIVYATDRMMLNGVYLLFTLNNSFCEKYFNKYKCIFNTVQHQELINQIKQIEEDVLKKCNIKHKIPQFKIYEQLLAGNIKLFNDIERNPENLFVLKIAGVWETSRHYGLTFKFMSSSFKMPNLV